MADWITSERKTTAPHRETSVQRDSLSDLEEALEHTSEVVLKGDDEFNAAIPLIRDNVYWYDFDNLLIILDMESGKYFALDPAGARVWRAVAEGIPLQDLLRRSPEKDDDGPHAAALLQILFERGLIISRDRRTPAKHGRRSLLKYLGARIFASRSSKIASGVSKAKKLWLFTEAYFVLIFVDVALLSLSFHGLFTGLAKIPCSPASSKDEIEYADSLCRVVLSAFRWYRPNVACMHRALGIYLFLRLKGIPAELCLGVEARPFASHTWAEYRGRVLGDSQGVCKTFRVIARLA